MCEKSRIKSFSIAVIFKNRWRVREHVIFKNSKKKFKKSASKFDEKVTRTYKSNAKEESTSRWEEQLTHEIAVSKDEEEVVAFSLRIRRTDRSVLYHVKSAGCRVWPVLWM